MKKFLIFSACILTGLYSCNKKAVLKPNTPLTYAITANVDGKEETFDSGDSVRAISTTGVYITGMNDTTQDRIGIYAFNYTAPFTTGTYTDTTSTTSWRAQILFYPAGDYADYYYDYYIPATYNYTCTVTVSSSSDSNIQGTFNGDLVLVNYISGTAALKTKTLTNGKFNINIK